MIAISHYPATIFVALKMSASYIQVHFRLDFIIEANIMNPDKTAPCAAV